jgi:hypothetical protein
VLPTAYLTRHPTLPQPLSHKPILEIAEPSTLLEVIFRQKHIPESQFPGSLFQVIDNGWVAFPPLLAFAELGVVDCVGWYAFLFDEFLNLRQKAD